MARGIWTQRRNRAGQTIKECQFCSCPDGCGCDGVPHGCGPMKASANKGGAMQDVRPGLRAMATRMENAEQNFISNVAQAGGISSDEAAKVMAQYKKAGVLKRDAVGGTLNVKHGAFMDKDVIHRALEAEQKSSESARTESLRDQHHGVDMTGPRGGSFHVSATGQKVYTRKG